MLTKRFGIFGTLCQVVLLDSNNLFVVVNQIKHTNLFADLVIDAVNQAIHFLPVTLSSLFLVHVGKHLICWYGFMRISKQF